MGIDHTQRRLQCGNDGEMPRLQPQRVFRSCQHIVQHSDFSRRASHGVHESIQLRAGHGVDVDFGQARAEVVEAGHDRFPRE